MSSLFAKHFLHFPDFSIEFIDHKLQAKCFSMYCWYTLPSFDVNYDFSAFIARVFVHVYRCYFTDGSGSIIIVLVVNITGVCAQQFTHQDFHVISIRFDLHKRHLSESRIITIFFVMKNTCFEYDLMWFLSMNTVSWSGFLCLCFLVGLKTNEITQQTMNHTKTRQDDMATHCLFYLYVAFHLCSRRLASARTSDKSSCRFFTL